MGPSNHMETVKTKSIYQAAAENDVEALLRVIHRVHIPDPDTGWTALHYAAEQNAVKAAQLLLDHGADPEAEANRVKPIDVASGDAVRALFPDEKRIPIDPKFQVLVPATYLLSQLGDPLAIQEFEALKHHPDYRVQDDAWEYEMGFEGLHHDHGQPSQQPLDAKTLANIQYLLRHRGLELRQRGLEWGLRLPDERLAPQVLPNLSGSAKELLPFASLLFRMCCTRDESVLAGIRPFLEIVIPPLPIPAEATPEEREELTKTNNKRAAKEYAIRSNAAKALMYPHGSQSTQDYLLAYFDDPERQLKRELHIAFQYCPDPQGLQQALLDMVEQPEPLRTHALFSLSHFRNPDHKDLFLSFLQSESPGTAKGALRGIQHHVTAADLPALQECRNRWR